MDDSLKWLPIENNTVVISPGETKYINDFKDYILGGLGSSFSVSSNDDMVGAVIDKNRIAITASGDIEEELTTTITIDAIKDSKTVRTEIRAIVDPVVEDNNYIEWYYFQPVNVTADDAGAFSGVILSSVDENLDNPSGASVAYTVSRKSANIATARTDSNNDVRIAFTGLTGSITASLTLSATATIDGSIVTTTADVVLNLIFRDLSDYVTKSDIPEEWPLEDLSPSVASDNDLTDFLEDVTVGDLPSKIPFRKLSNSVASDNDLTDFLEDVTVGDLPTKIPFGRLSNSVASDNDLDDFLEDVTVGDLPAKIPFSKLSNSVASDNDLTDFLEDVTVGDVPKLPYSKLPTNVASDNDLSDFLDDVT
ncbi:MAG: hypothetical protein OXE50_15625, partial [Chloroflexi bacterium]|nr:hypothetical protein [Chloroflexota bacterium]